MLLLCVMNPSVLSDQNITSATDLQAQILQGFIDILPILIAVSIVIWVAVAFVTSRLFQKFNAPQWAAWVPIANTWYLLQIGKQPGWIALFGVVPYIFFVPLIFLIPSVININRALGKHDSFLAMAALLPVVWLGWVAFDDSQPNQQYLNSIKPK